jgi:hypothetical protein
VPLSFRICRFQGFSAGPALEPLISNFFVDRGHLWRPFKLSGLRGHWLVIAPFEGQFFEPGARAARGSSLLGKGPGHLMPTVAAIVLRRGRAFSCATAARVVGDVGRRT